MDCVMCRKYGGVLHSMVDSQVVRHCTLTAIFVGSNPTPPAKKKNGMGELRCN